MHRRTEYRVCLGAAALCLSLQQAAAISAPSRQVEVPMEFSASYVKEQALQQVFTDGEHRARVWDDGSGCNFLVLSEPVVTISADGVRFSSPAEGRTGKPVGDRCLFLVEWHGIVEVDERPRVNDSGTAIEFEVIDSRLLDEQGNRGLSGAIWDWTKKHVHPRLQAMRLDATPALQELRYFLPLFLPQADADNLAALLASVRMSSVTTGSDGIAANLSFTVPERVADDRPAVDSEPALDDSELEGLDLALKQFDAFITFVVKNAAFSTKSSTQREELLDILLDARYALLDSATGERVSGRDPVRILFVDTWRRMAPILRHISHDLPGKHALNFLSFIAAADALKGIDELGPSIGLEISTDALRRMARLMSPEATGDPLEYDERVDPAIRDAFEFGAPLTQPPAPAPPPSGGWLIRSAWAGSDARRESLDRLNRWLPRREELPSYLLRVRMLLEDTADDILEAKPLESRFRDIFRPLMLATAWQESCWRQFVNKDGKRWPISSAAGAVGMMQVLPRVWRGFYDPHSLSWDMGYNVSAGGEILHHYLVKYAIRKDEHGKTGQLHNLARATYSVYNAGPGRLTRYRDTNAGDRARRVDRSFWEKYQSIRKGNYAAVQECYS